MGPGQALQLASSYAEIFVGKGPIDPSIANEYSYFELLKPHNKAFEDLCVES